MAKKCIDPRQDGLPGLSTLPQMPEGYYSGDQPNPNLGKFVEEHATPYDAETDTYSVVGFNQPITTTKVTAVYNMHTYWSKKPHDAVRQYIRHYTQPGDLVLDPFCGSGGTALAALMEGRKAIAIDRSPAATFITKNYCTPVDTRGLRQAFNDLRRMVQPEMDWLFGTQCDRCGGPATTQYTVYSQVFLCPRCRTKFPLFDCVKVEAQTAAGKPKKVNACPICHAKGHTEEIRSQSQKYGFKPVVVRYVCAGACKPAAAERRHNDPDPRKRESYEKCDQARLQEIDATSIPYWYPQGYDMTGFSRYRRDALYYYGVKEVADLFTRRNLWALAAIRNAANTLEGHAKDVALFALSGIALGMSRMNRYRPDVTYPTNVMNGMYYVPQISQEEPPLKHFLNKADRLLKGFGVIAEAVKDSSCLISTQSAQDLAEIPANTIDYIFTDPPYSNATAC